MLSVGLIRVISLESKEKQEVHARLMMRLYPSLKVFTKAIEGFPHGLYNDELVTRAIPAILRAAAKLAPQVDALAVSCAEDPGVDELRKRYQIPVVGAGSALAWASRALGRCTGVLTITSQLPTPLQEAFQSYRPVWKQVDRVKRTTDLEAAQERIFAGASELVDQGCDVLALACTGFSTLDVAPVLAERLNVPVVDPVVAMGALLSLIKIPSQGGDKRGDSTSFHERNTNKTEDKSEKGGST
ncbi:MAG: aspartate/glutamate racemase family protein [candidate division WOR-3 bacterium]|nr:aspartate/glutamate racemase family protein [candidate division WOR-3 bacterium]